MNATFNLDTIRIMLHVLGVTVWLGGQIVLVGILPVLREANVEGLPAQVARAFMKVAAPAFALTFLTGIWNLFEVDLQAASSGYNAVFGIKFILVLVSGFSASVHSRTDDPKKRAVTGALGLLSAFVAFFLGFVL